MTGAVITPALLSIQERRIYETYRCWLGGEAGRIIELPDGSVIARWPAKPARCNHQGPLTAVLCDRRKGRLF